MAICGFLFFVGIVLMIAAGILRGSVALANRILGASNAAAPFIAEIDEDDEEEVDEWTGYRKKISRIKSLRNTTNRIPEPGIMASIGFAFLTGVIGLLGGIFTRLIFDLAPFGPGFPGNEQDLFAAHAAGFVFAFPFSAGLLAWALPTTFPRACLVVLVNDLLYLILGIALGTIF